MSDMTYRFDVTCAIHTWPAGCCVPSYLDHALTVAYIETNLSGIILIESPSALMTTKTFIVESYAATQGRYIRR